jgi:hypothetical protein
LHIMQYSLTRDDKIKSSWSFTLIFNSFTSHLDYSWIENAEFRYCHQNPVFIFFVAAFIITFAAK